jgi:hypothetical protein
MVTSLLVLLAAVGAGPVTESADDVMTRSRAAYQALHSYSDEGEVVSETRLAGTAVRSVDRDSFKTAFQQEPRKFFFKFTKQGGEEYVIWIDGAEVNSWWSATRVRSNYNQKPAAVFALAGSPTKGITDIVPPLIFPKGRLKGPLTEMKELHLENDERVDGHACFKISGQEKVGFGSDMRPITVWIDRETLLVRRILEDTPPSQGQGAVWRRTTTLRPMANPALPASAFTFDSSR